MKNIIRVLVKGFLPFIFATGLLASGCSSTTGMDIKPVSVTIEEANETFKVEGAISKYDVIYVPLDVLDRLTSVVVNYSQDTGQIVVTRSNLTFTLQLDQPFKAGDEKGPKPFLQEGTVYMPLIDTATLLNFKVTKEKAGDGSIQLAMEIQGFDYSNLWKQMSPAELEQAETVLAKGVKITDPEADWAPISEGVQPDGRMDNAKPYPLAFTDIRSVNFNADSQYLYLKMELNSIIPDKMVYYQNTDKNQMDFIHSMGCNLGLHSYYNHITGKEDTGLMQLGLTYVIGDPRGNLTDPQLFPTPLVAISNFATPTGSKDSSNEDIYSLANGNGLVYGGSGMNYIMAAFPLADYGMQPGDEIEFDLSLEAGSKLFHHECVDVVLDCGYKAGSTIRYKLGSNSYENLGPAANLLPL